MSLKLKLKIWEGRRGKGRSQVLNDMTNLMQQINTEAIYTSGNYTYVHLELTERN